MKNKDLVRISTAICNALMYRQTIAIADFDLIDPIDVATTLEGLVSYLKERRSTPFVIYVHRGVLNHLLLEPIFAAEFEPHRKMEVVLLGLVGHLVGTPVICDDVIPMAARSWLPVKENHLMVLEATGWKNTSEGYAALKDNGDDQQKTVFSH